MADLAQALDEALRGRYRVTEVRTPITQRRGLTARMSQLEKHHARPGDRPGQAAARAARSAGIAPQTWNRWRKGIQPPSSASLRKLEGAYTRQITLPAYRRALKRRKTPNVVIVWARVKWSRSDGTQYNQRDNGYRRVRLESMRPVMNDTIKAWVGAGPQAAADAFQWGVSTLYKVDPDGDRPGIEFQGNDVKIQFSEEEN